MFEKIGRLAETAANKVSVSRRGFLGRLGQGALALTGVLGGLLAIPTAARAAGSYVCCKWHCRGLYGNYTVQFCYPPGSTCGLRGAIGGSCGTPKQTAVSSCAHC
jgi:hypothetical protein